MPIFKSSSSNPDDDHNYNKVFVSVEPNKYKRDDPPSPMLKFECNVKINYVPDGTEDDDTSNIEVHDSWCFFHIPYDMFTCDDNFASSSSSNFQPRSYICQILDLMKIPFELQDHSLFWKQSDVFVRPLENPDDIVTLIVDVARAMAEGVGVSQGKGLVLVDSGETSQGFEE